jgi:hypothetical protein
MLNKSAARSKSSGAYRRPRFFLAGFMIVPRQLGAPHLQT